MPRCQSSSLISSTGPFGPWPALLTTASTRPHFCRVVSTRRARSSGERLEPVTPSPPNSCASDSPLPDEDKMATR
ncbi:hypothetical protein D3C78_1401620 [compost metagenome]